VRPEFVALGARPDRSAAEEARLTELKNEMAERLTPLDPQTIYNCREVSWGLQASTSEIGNA
jgi:hypothetical protein